MFEYIDKLKKETNYISDIIYRKKKIKNKNICIIYNEPLVSSNKVSDFIIKSLDNLDDVTSKNLLQNINNNIYNFKVVNITSYNDMCFYLHKGFTIILIEGEDKIIALETKADLKRSISTPHAENTIRGSKDSFVEDYQANIGLIKKRLKTNDLWIKNLNIGKYTNTQVGLLYINGICKQKLVDQIYQKLEKITIDGVVNIGTIKNLIEKENKSPFPTTLSTERPEKVAKALLDGKVCLTIDNDPYVLIMPAFLNDFTKNSEDYYSKSINATFNRIIRFLALIIALFTPAIYIALITYNQEMIPTQFLISFSIQRSSVPFPAFIEAFMMITAFDILREADLRTPSFTGSSLSIVGALILGDAAVSAGIVSPIMIIVIATTSIASLLFNEYEFINSLRWYRIIFMLGASFLGIIGFVAAFIYFIINLCCLNTYGLPYLLPYTPMNYKGLEDSIIKAKTNKIFDRPRYLFNRKRQDKDEN